MRNTLLTIDKGNIPFFKLNLNKNSQEHANAPKKAFRVLGLGSDLSRLLRDYSVMVSFNYFKGLEISRVLFIDFELKQELNYNLI